MAITKDFISTKLLLETVTPAAIIRPITMGLIPSNVQATYLEFLNFSSDANITLITINDGSITAKVATIAPKKPLTLNPRNVAAFTAIGPGVISDIANISINSLLVIQA